MRNIILAALFLFLLGGCMGGGTIGTGLGYGKNTATRAPVLRYGVKGALKDAKGKDLSGVSIRVQTSAYSHQTFTASNGKFVLDIEAKAGEPITFIFEKGSIYASCTTNISPAGEDFVTMNFSLKDYGSVICSIGK